MNKNYLFVALLLFTQLFIAEIKAFSTEIDTSKKFYCNAVLLKNKPFRSVLSPITTGKVSVVYGDPDGMKREKIPFYIRLERNGQTVSSLEYARKQFYDFEISQMLKYAKKNDRLIITPVNKEDWRAKRVIKIDSFLSELNGC